jgi:hypothetical protein
MLAPMIRLAGLARLLLPVLVLVLAAGTHAGGAFVPGTEDVPLMPGLAAVDGTELVFDKPQGRIVQAQARGRVKPEAVRRFYGETLPGLGWTEAGPQRWQRESEALAIDIKGRDGAVTVGFTLTPRKAGD